VWRKQDKRLRKDCKTGREAEKEMSRFDDGPVMRNEMDSVCVSIHEWASEESVDRTRKGGCMWWRHETTEKGNYIR